MPKDLFRTILVQHKAILSLEVENANVRGAVLDKEIWGKAFNQGCQLLNAYDDYKAELAQARENCAD